MGKREQCHRASLLVVEDGDLHRQLITDMATGDHRCFLELRFDPLGQELTEGFVRSADSETGRDWLGHHPSDLTAVNIVPQLERRRRAGCQSKEFFSTTNFSPRIMTVSPRLMGKNCREICTSQEVIWPSRDTEVRFSTAVSETRHPSIN
ncbi:hypothetical protein [Corynebacterium efficiens YS-314]|uniref:Uncharacterized protein n=1 Tax=Corynebacterium efficiens (strain DSM 44549 / YS-314 / AJ 12310 / JCM 11189 / NBRC 100395) TaxID=196164 RepID=Q8FRB3_COREF|nr:hypothetical protein [Corynebacterium efficiens YS-314]